MIFGFWKFLVRYMYEKKNKIHFWSLVKVVLGLDVQPEIQKLPSLVYK